MEETPKKCKDIMKTAKSLMDEVTWAEFGADPREEVSVFLIGSFLTNSQDDAFFFFFFPMCCYSFFFFVYMLSCNYLCIILSLCS